jgi:MFS family permease
MGLELPDLRTEATPPAGTGLFAFYRSMSRRELRTFWACSTGWMLDALDVALYPLVIGVIAAEWRVRPGAAGLAVTATLCSSALGGWLGGFLSDRIGRVRTLQLTILWFSIFSGLCAVSTNFTQLLVTRTLLGFGFGGEWAAGAVLLGEVVRPAFRGRAVGVMQSAWAVGGATAALLQALVFTFVPPTLAWRLLFLIGLAPAGFVWWLRRGLSESDAAAEARLHRRESGSRNAIWDIFAPDVLRTTALASLLAVGAQGGSYAVSAWLPYLLTSERGLSIVGSSGYIVVFTIGQFCGYLAAARLSDQIGRRGVFFAFAICAVAIIPIYTLAPVSHGVLWVLGFPLGFFSTGYYAVLGPFLTELFPTRLRGSAQGFCYNFGRGVGALFPTLVGLLSRRLSLALAISLFAAPAYLILAVAAYALPETLGKQIQED